LTNGEFDGYLECNGTDHEEEITKKKTENITVLITKSNYKKPKKEYSD
jgi:hypothetical protein